MTNLDYSSLSRSPRGRRVQQLVRRSQRASEAPRAPAVSLNANRARRERFRSARWTPAKATHVATRESDASIRQQDRQASLGPRAAAGAAAAATAGACSEVKQKTRAMEKCAQSCQTPRDLAALKMRGDGEATCPPPRSDCAAWGVRRRWRDACGGNRPDGAGTWPGVPSAAMRTAPRHP